MFQAHTRLNHSTFRFVVSIVAPTLERQNTILRECIFVEIRVAIALARRGSGNSLEMCGEVYGVAESMAYL